MSRCHWVLWCKLFLIGCRKWQKAKPRQEMSGGVVAANLTPQPPPQITADHGCKRSAAAADRR